MSIDTFRSLRNLSVKSKSPSHNPPAIINFGIPFLQRADRAPYAWNTLEAKRAALGLEVEETLYYSQIIRWHLQCEYLRFVEEIQCSKQSWTCSCCQQRRQLFSSKS